MEATLLIKDVKNYIKGLAPTETPYIFPKKDKKNNSTESPND